MSNLERPPPACCGNLSRLAVLSISIPPLHLEVIAAILLWWALRRILADCSLRCPRSPSAKSASTAGIMFSLSKTYPEAHSLSSDSAVTIAWFRTVDLSALSPSIYPVLHKLSLSPSLSMVMRIMLRALKSFVNIEHVQ